MSLTSESRLNKIFCLIGPSGTGKSALANMIPIPKVVSYRTRDIREGEANGVDGHFITKEEFLEKKEKNLWIAETNYAGNYYGITQGELIELEESPMIYVIDYDGYEYLKENINKIKGYSSEQLVSIFIHTPREDLETRMLRRGEHREVIRARLDRADRDYAFSSKCDYIVHNKNGEIDRSAYELIDIILRETFPTKYNKK